FDYGLLYWERVLRSVSNSTRQDGLEFLQLAASIPLTVQVQPYPLTEANAALASLKHGGITGAAVLEITDDGGS
ncbi:MAG TPA: alcohol dehydrogenase, partial [bacterium]|nr:alcohol dehydrogenase [bacterium]